MSISNNISPEEIKKKSSPIIYIMILIVIVLISGGIYVYANYTKKDLPKVITSTPQSTLTTTPTLQSTLTTTPTPTQINYLTPKQITDKYSGGTCGVKLPWEGAEIVASGYIDFPEPSLESFGYGRNFHLDTDSAMVGQGKYFDSIEVSISDDLVNQTFYDKLKSLHESRRKVSINITLNAKDFPTNGSCNRYISANLPIDSIVISK